MTDKTAQNLLTVLVEDYFHVGAFGNLIEQERWTRFEPRYVQNTLKVLDLLDKYESKATFFALGWIAFNTPDLIKEIVRRGHTVACRGFEHKIVRRLSREDFRTELLKTRDALETAAQTPVIGYRSAEKMFFPKDLWTLEVLAEEGFVYDASFLPTAKGVAENNKRRFAFEHETEKGARIWEFPYPTKNIGGFLLPIAGGNYYRQLPYTFLRRFVRKWHQRHDAPFLMYFHVWELDQEQPRINAASPYNRIRHYRKLDKMKWIIEENLKMQRFKSIEQSLFENNLQLPERRAINNLSVQSKTAKKSAQNSVSPERKLTPVTIVIPAYNEEPTLPYLANTLTSVVKTLSAGYEVKFIFVDDSSTDGTFAKLKELFGANLRAKIVQHEENKGVAATILTGINAADTEVVCSIDCDCTYDPHELSAMLPLLTEDVSMVTASPYHPQGGVKNVPAWRLSLSKGASFLYQKVLGSDLHTFTSCFRVYRRSVAANLPIERQNFLGIAEILGKIYLGGGKIVEYPAVLEVRLFGFSKMKTVRTIFGHLDLLAELARRRFGKNSAIKHSLINETPLKSKEIIEKDKGN